MSSAFDLVRIKLEYANGGIAFVPPLSRRAIYRWQAEWVVVNEIAGGYYRGRRVLAATIVPAN